MRKSFVANTAPVLTGVVRARTVWEAMKQVRESELKGAKGIDLHLSCLNDEYKNVESIKKIIEFSKLPILVLNYNQTMEWDVYETSEEERINLLMMGLEAGAAGVDIQGYTYDRPSHFAFDEKFADANYSFIKNKPREVVVNPEIIKKQTELIERVHSMGGEVLLSNHLLKPMKTEELVDLCHFLEERKPDIIKIVCHCDTEEEMLESFRSMMTLKREIKTPVTLFCNGKTGMYTRILNPIFGGYMVFTPASHDAYSFGQLDLETAKRVYDGIECFLGDFYKG